MQESVRHGQPAPDGVFSQGAGLVDEVIEPEPDAAHSEDGNQWDWGSWSGEPEPEPEQRQRPSRRRRQSLKKTQLISDQCSTA